MRKSALDKILKAQKNTFKPLPIYTTRVPVSVGLLGLVGAVFTWVYVIAAFVA
tara:strand:- start:204 stop:362 length:159 start_codon:yes stop_codon:yes gene_type:complete